MNHLNYKLMHMTTGEAQEGLSGWRNRIRNMLDVIGGEELVRALIQQWRRKGLGWKEIEDQLHQGGATGGEIRKLLPPEESQK